MTDIELIKQLEAQTGKLLKQIPLNQMESFLASGSYTLDINNNCIAINLSQFALNQIPAALLQMPNLQEVYLQYNNLTQIPAEINNWKFLNKLNLNDNKITHLPKTITDFGLEISYYLKPLPRAIFLNKNPLIYPPLNIIEQGMAAIKNFFENSSTPPPAIEKKEIKVEYTGSKETDDLSLIDKILAEPVIEKVTETTENTTVVPPPPPIENTTIVPPPPPVENTNIIPPPPPVENTTIVPPPPPVMNNFDNTIEINTPELSEKIPENDIKTENSPMPELKTIVKKDDDTIQP